MNRKTRRTIHMEFASGNSVAMGEGLYGFDNEKTFASQLENQLRIKNPKIIN